MIIATVKYRYGALRLLVDAGADLNLQNEVRYEVTMYTALHHVLFLALGGSDGSYDFSKGWEGGTDRYFTGRKRHRHGHSGECETPDYISHYGVMDVYLSQSTGWSALFFCAENGDVKTSDSLLKAGANALLKDKVCKL